jgi:hypothetical protein
MFAADVAESLVGADHVVRDLEPSMGAEDFSFMLQTKPGAYLRIGQGTGASGSAFLHNSRYDFNDDILPLGSALHAGLIEQSMPLAMPDCSFMRSEKDGFFFPSSLAQGESMKSERKLLGSSLLRRCSYMSLVASAQTVRIANQGDALSMDPHSLNESLQLSTGNVYEALVGRNKDLSLAPAWPRPGSRLRPPCGD